MFENRVLRKVFGPNRDEVTGEWRILHSKELYDRYSLPNIICVINSRTSWVGHVARMGGEERCLQDFVGNPERKRPLGRRHRRVSRIILK
jgi:hypothetical protein